jgi:hypothetical protein
MASISAIKPGARVVTADAKQLGMVKDIRDEQFLVDVRWASDYWLGIETVEDASEDVVQLLIAKAGVGPAKLPEIKNIDDSGMPSRQ